MGNVAMLLAQAGHEVKGSDENAFPPMGPQLEKTGIRIRLGYAAENVCEGFVPEVLVISNALSRGHAEIVEAQRLGIRISGFPEILYEMILKDRRPVVIAGTHGKTTTTAMTAHVLQPLQAGCLVGGILKTGESGFRLGAGGAPFAIEGDEYGTSCFDPGAKFLHYHPDTLVLTHMEWDHLDIYPSFDEFQRPFARLLEEMGSEKTVLTCAEAPHLASFMASRRRGRHLNYGFAEGCDYRMLGCRRLEEATEIEISEQGGAAWSLRLPVYGKIYLLNALAACAVARHYGMSVDAIRERMATFPGVRRRLEVLRDGQPFFLFSDFAHHPTAVEETLGILRERFPDRPLWAVYDPRNASSRRNTFHADFVKALGSADRVILGPPHPDQRLEADKRLDVQRLAADIGPKAIGCRDAGELRACFDAPIPEGAVVVVMSCGACHGLIQELAGSEHGRLEPSA